MSTPPQSSLVKEEDNILQFSSFEGDVAVMKHSNEKWPETHDNVTEI